MSDDAGKNPRAELSSLLSTMRKAPHVTVAAPKPVVPDASFESLPAYQQMLFQRQFARYAELDVPYYREHAGRSGATALIGNREVVNFASYDYLGLNGHPAVIAAAEEALRLYGSSVSASRISAGERAPHRDLERGLAAVYDAPDCVAFNSGHAAGVSTIATLIGPKDMIVHDALIHNCIVVGAQLSGANRRVFPHNDLDALDHLLTAERARFGRVLIVAEGLYSMDGDGPDLARLIALKQKHGAWLMIDDAHGLGVLGKTGKGLFEHQSVDPAGVDLWFGTLSKSLVGCGGYVAGNAVAVDLLRHLAPGFVYSVGMPASVAAASAKALEIMRDEPERAERLAAMSQRFLTRAKAKGLDTGTAWGYGVIPIMVGETARTLVLSEKLLARGYNAFPILPPGVPEKSSRLRFFINATHTEEMIDGAVDAVAALLDDVRVVSVASILKSRAG